MSGFRYVFFDHKADVRLRNISYSGSALYNFCKREGTVGMINVLVEAGMDIIVRDADGEPPLLNAIFCRFTAAAQKLSTKNRIQYRLMAFRPFPGSSFFCKFSRYAGHRIKLFRVILRRKSCCSMRHDVLISLNESTTLAVALTLCIAYPDVDRCLISA